MQTRLERGHGMEKYNFEIRLYTHKILFLLIPAVMFLLLGFFANDFLSSGILTIVGILLVFYVLLQFFNPIRIRVEGDTIMWQSKAQFDIQDISYIFVHKEARSPHYEITFRVKNENYGVNSRMKHFDTMVEYILYMHKNHRLKSDAVLSSECLEELYAFQRKK